MTSHFDSLVHIVTDVHTYDISNDAAIGLLKGNDCRLSDNDELFNLAAWSDECHSRTINNRVYVKDILYSVSQKNPFPRGPHIFFIFFTNGWEFVIDFLHRVNSRNAATAWWQHHKRCPGIIIIIITQYVEKVMVCCGEQLTCSTTHNQKEEVIEGTKNNKKLSYHRGTTLQRHIPLEVK